MSLYNYDVVLLLGAGASKPLGIPTSDEMVKQFLATKAAEPLLPFKKRIIGKNWDIEKLLRLILHVKILGKDPPLKPLLGGALTESLQKKLLDLNQSHEKVYDDLLRFIRRRCLKPNLKKARKIYGPLLRQRENAAIKIFTTNYDTAIENVCRDLQIEFNDGFASSTFEDYKRFYPNRLGKGSVQLYKLHGSVNWWSDITRQVVFRLSLDLEGLKGVKTMMIYPAEIESTFRYPFNILQSYFISSLINTKKVIAIGHKFGDVNISSPIRVLLERPDFKLSLISPDAKTTKKTVFNNHAKIEAIPEKVETWMSKGVKRISADIKKFEKNRKEAIREAERKMKEERERIREEIEEKYRPKAFTAEIPITIDAEAFSNIPLKRACPNCGKDIPTFAYLCPHCGAEVYHI